MTCAVSERLPFDITTNEDKPIFKAVLNEDFSEESLAEFHEKNASFNPVLSPGAQQATESGLFSQQSRTRKRGDEYSRDDDLKTVYRGLKVGSLAAEP